MFFFNPIQPVLQRFGAGFFNTFRLLGWRFHCLDHSYWLDQLYIFCVMDLRLFWPVVYAWVVFTVPDYVKPGSWCRLSRAHSWFGETPGGREIGVGREWGRGGQFMSNLGPGWTGSHHPKGGIPSEKKGIRKGEPARGIKRVAPWFSTAILCMRIIS